MAHNLEIVNGEASMAYVGDVPWHGLGTSIQPGASPYEIMCAANLDWQVEKHDVYFRDEDGVERECGKRKALVRSTDKKYLSMVTKDWVPVQIQEQFDFFNEYCEAGGMEMHTAGALAGGTNIWALAKVNESFDLFGGKDKVDSHLLLSNSFIYGKGVIVRFTPIRVVCNNTLSMALEGESNLSISLNHRQEFDAEKVKEALAQASTKMNTYKEMAEFLSKKRYTEQSVFEYFNQVFPKTSNIVSFDEMMKKFKAGELNVASRNAQRAMELVKTGEAPGAELGRGTFWEAYNTVTYMTNHETGHNADTRMQSVWFGSNKDRNMKSLGLALEMAEAA